MGPIWDFIPGMERRTRPGEFSGHGKKSTHLLFTLRNPGQKTKGLRIISFRLSVWGIAAPPQFRAQVPGVKVNCTYLTQPGHLQVCDPRKLLKLSVPQFPHLWIMIPTLPRAGVAIPWRAQRGTRHQVCSVNGSGYYISSSVHNLALIITIIRFQALR